MSKDEKNQTGNESGNGENQDQNQNQTDTSKNDDAGSNNTDKGTSTNNANSNAGSGTSKNDDKKDNLDKKALAGIVQGKDKKINDLQSQLEATNSKLEAMANENKVKEMILDSDYPDKVKITLKQNIGSLTPDNFEDVGNQYLDLFNSGIEQAKGTLQDLKNKKPDKSDQKPDEKTVKQIQGVKSREELDQILKEQQS